jgi:phage terminase small subunit
MPRLKKPIPIRAAEGDVRKLGANKHRAMIAEAFRAKTGVIECPPELNGLARRHFDYLVENLNREGLLALMDKGSLVSAATNYQAMITAYKARKWRDLDIASARYTAMADRLGLHESARAKLTRRPEQLDALDAAMCG